MLLERIDYNDLETVNKNEINLYRGRIHHIKFKQSGYVYLLCYQNPYFIYKEINEDPICITIKIGNSIINSLTLKNKEMKKIASLYIEESEELSIEVECSSQTAIRVFENAVHQKNRS